MPQRIFALLVGINDYAPNVGKLRGCLNDVDHYHQYLLDNFDQANLHIEILKDADATRQNIIDHFRSHLCQATEDDIAVFQYAGHGAQWKSAPEFQRYFPGGFDEGLVCYDSRRESDLYDLADKELALLLSEVAAKNPHLTVILDCCHSGSGTRSADHILHFKPRSSHTVEQHRPIESYIDSYYQRQLDESGEIVIPSSRHILLAACERKQQAFEGYDRRGIFSSALLSTLENHNSDVSYADLFLRIRTNIRKKAHGQNPQFETFQGFNGYAGFLGCSAARTTRRFGVHFTKDAWTADCGAIHGLPTRPDQRVELEIYPEDDTSDSIGRATVDDVDLSSSCVTLDFDAEKGNRYEAQITSLPSPPITVRVDGDEEGIAMLKEVQNETDEFNDIALCEGQSIGTALVIHAINDGYELRQVSSDLLIQGTTGGYLPEAAGYIFSIVQHIATWQAIQDLQNEAPGTNTQLASLTFHEIRKNAQGNDTEFEHAGDEVTLDVIRDNDGWQPVYGRICSRNDSDQTLQYMLVQFTDAYGIEVVYKDEVPPTRETFNILVADDPVIEINLERDDATEELITLVLFVSASEIDAMQLQQDELEIGKVVHLTGRKIKTRKKKLEPVTWFTKKLRLRLVGQTNEVGAAETSLANDRIKISSHPDFRASASLTPAHHGGRSVAASNDFYHALELDGFELLNLAASRGDGASVLELTNIENAESLADHPLEIEMKSDLAEDEFLIPVAFDGKCPIVVGDCDKSDDGSTTISIHAIPEMSDNRRSVVKALRLYFFKTVLKRNDVNQLRWVKYNDNGTFSRQTADLAEKVASANNILLLIHGIIGDTKGIVDGTLQTSGSDDQSISQQFDLVLTYDYENLATPIEQTAVDLKTQLAAAGVGADDDKRLTIVAHSMGGLVSRWMIEQESGHQFVDRLVMCGTPNGGSPFGLVEPARIVLTGMSALALSFMPALAAFTEGLKYYMKKSKDFTPTLEQMAPDSDFLKKLNTSDDPGIPYSILAGDIDQYEEDPDGMIADIVNKVGKSKPLDMIFSNAPHDIAVSCESIRNVAAQRQPVPAKVNVACHHMNYFSSEAGSQALALVLSGQVVGEE